MENIAYFFAGMVAGIVLVLAFFWLVSRNINKSESADDWWKKGEPPPY